MPTDIRDAFTGASQAPWSRQTFEHVLSRLASVLQGEVNWDSGAGEGWGRVLRDGDVVALLWCQSPLAVLVRGVERASRLELPPAGTVVVVPSMAERCLSADRASLDAFAGRMTSPAIDPAAFSADELWWATI